MTKYGRAFVKYPVNLQKEISEIYEEILSSET